MRVLVTGSTGFVGRSVVRELIARGDTVVRTLRKPAQPIEGAMDVVVGEISPTTDWTPGLVGVELVIHLAARVHHVGEGSGNDHLYDQVNHLATKALANQAVAVGVPAFLFVSSAKVYGEVSPPGERFHEDTPCDPQGGYAISKWAAERHLLHLTESTDLHTSIIRPPVVYGPGASGNIARLVNLIDTGVPLPFKNAANARSMISVSNLAKAIVHVGEMQGRGPHIFNATDVTLSTFELVAHLARGMGRKVRCFSVPRAALSLTRRSPARSIVDRLWGDFALDSSALRRTGWRPELSAIEELYQTARYLMENRTR